MPVLETISEEDVLCLRRVFRVIFLVSLISNLILASYCSFRASQTLSGESGVGFVLVLVMLWTSSVFSWLFERACVREAALEIFQQPCLIRWISCALTFPIQVVVCAWYCGVRDMYVYVLLVAAEVVCMLLGFIMEQAWNSRDLQEVPAVQRLDPLELSVGRVVRGPKTDPLLILSQSCKAMIAWTVCFLCVSILHSSVWFTVLEALVASKNNTRLDLMVQAQCGLMCLFWVVPVLQVGTWWLGAGSVDEILVAGSIAFAALDIAMKVQLAVAYAVMWI
jgi:hypothetical protein